MLVRFNKEYKGSLVGKIVFFEGMIGDLFVGKPCLVESETGASIRFRPARLNVLANMSVDTRESGYFSPWVDLTIADFEEWSEDDLRTKRKSGILYVADTLEDALPFYNLSHRINRKIEIARREAIRERKLAVEELLGAPVSTTQG